MKHFVKRNSWNENAGAKTFAQRKPARSSNSRDLSNGINGSPAIVAQLKKLQRLFGGAAQLRSSEEAASPSVASLPHNLKVGIESLSGISMDNVAVHYNSSQPAQLNALAFAQGRDIHLGPGQETHLPHEAWHLVQQSQGRVKPTTQKKSGTPVNDDARLEREADVMGARASATRQEVSALQSKPLQAQPVADASVQLKKKRLLRGYPLNGAPQEGLSILEVRVKRYQDYPVPEAHEIFEQDELWKIMELLRDINEEITDLEHKESKKGDKKNVAFIGALAKLKESVVNESRAVDDIFRKSYANAPAAPLPSSGGEGKRFDQRFLESEEGYYRAGREVRGHVQFPIDRDMDKKYK